MRLVFARGLAVGIAVLAAACSPGSQASEPPASRAGDAQDKSPVAAEGGALSISLAEVDAKVGSEALAQIREKEYELRRQALDQLLDEKLLAREASAKGIPVEELLRREVDAKTQAPDPAEVDRLYEQNKRRFGSTPREQVVADIQAALHSRARDARRAAFRRELAKKAGIRVRLEPPRAEVAVPADAPVLGPATAPVTIVEFADYQCPYCHAAQQTVEEVLKQYAGKVRLVHRDFPLDFHPRALAAAHAARCAAEQGKFWEYHRNLLGVPGDLSDADLTKRAESLSLNLTTFTSCLAYPNIEGPIRKNLADGNRLGVDGTPTFFVNGRRMTGARRLEEFQDVIDDELERHGN